MQSQASAFVLHRGHRLPSAPMTLSPKGQVSLDLEAPASVELGPALFHCAARASLLTSLGLGSLFREMKK